MTAHIQRLPVSIEPLIGEAKQRMRRRRFLLAVLAGVVALALGLTLALRPFGTGTFRGGPGAWLPQGVQEIDVRAPNPPITARVPSPPTSLRVTNPAKVKRIVAWFNRLEQNSSSVTMHGVALACINGLANNIAFTFRGANGHALARAYSSPGAAWYCDPIQLTAGAQRASFLIDPNRWNPLIGRVEGLLGFSSDVRVVLG